MNKTFKIINLIVLGLIGTVSLNIIPEVEEDNLFYDINQQLQDAIDKIFTFLKLNNQFIGHNETRLLLSTIASLKHISEGRFVIYSEVINASKLELKFIEQRNSSLFKLDKPIDEIMAEEFNVNNTIKPKDVDDINSIEIPDDSNEAFVLLRDYLANFNDVDLADILKPSKKIKEMFERHKQFRYARRKNLKVWRPSNSSELLKSDARRVFRSSQAKIKKFPFLASIHVKGKFVGTGTIVSRNMVITAASCLLEASHNRKYLKDHRRSVYVRVGSEFPDRFGEFIEASNIIVHPEYESATLRNNIAILQIKKHLHLRKKSRKIRRIEFHRMKGDLPNYVREVILLGWGEKEEEKSQLSYSYLKMCKYEDCVDVYSNRYVTKNNFCAGNSGHGAGACQKDVGGPAIVSNILMGIVSFGPPVCGAPHSPTVFTNIGNYATWIESIVEGNTDRTNPPASTSPNMQLPPIGYPDGQIPKPAFDNNNKNSKVEYPQSVNSFSNVLRQFMINNREVDQHNPFGNTSMTTRLSTKNHHNHKDRNEQDLMIPFNINDYTTTRRTTPTTSQQGQANHAFQIKPYNNYYASHKNYNMTTNRQYQFMTSSITSNQRYPFLSSRVLPNQRYQYSTSNGMQAPPQNSFPGLTMGNPRYQFSYSTSSLLHNTQYRFPSPKNILRYETSTKKSTVHEDSSSDSDNYESEEEAGLEIEMPSTDLSPPKFDQYEPLINMPMLPYRPNFDLSRSAAKDSLELIRYFVKNKLGPVGSRLGLPIINNFEMEAEKFLMQNYLRERLNPMNRLNIPPRNILKTLSYLDQGLSLEDESEKILGKNFFKHQLQEKDEVSDEFVLLLLKHTTVKRKKNRYKVSDNFGRKDVDIINSFTSFLQATRQIKLFKQTTLNPEQVFIINDSQKPKEKKTPIQSLQDKDKEFKNILSLLKHQSSSIELRNNPKIEKPPQKQQRRTQIPRVDKQSRLEEVEETTDHLNSTGGAQKRPSKRIISAKSLIDYEAFINEKIRPRLIDLNKTDSSKSVSYNTNSLTDAYLFTSADNKKNIVPNFDQKKSDVSQLDPIYDSLTNAKSEDENNFDSKYVSSSEHVSAGDDSKQSDQG